MDISLKIAEELQIKRSQVDAAVGLIDEGNTIPFIARYRKEVTGSLNDEQLRTLHERLVYLRNLEEKKASYIKSNFKAITYNINNSCAICRRLYRI